MFRDVTSDYRIVVDGGVGAAYHVERKEQRAHEAVRTAMPEFAGPRVVGGTRQHIAWYLISYGVEEGGGSFVVVTLGVDDSKYVAGSAVCKHQPQIGVVHHDGIPSGIECADELLVEAVVRGNRGDVLGGSDISLDRT